MPSITRMRNLRIFDFAGWKAALSVDANSQYTTGRPTGMRVFVRPNQEEIGRADITIYNFDNQDYATVSLSQAGLAPEQAYEIRDVQDYFGQPIVIGTYDGSAVRVPLNLTAVTRIVGANYIL